MPDSLQGSNNVADDCEKLLENEEQHSSLLDAGTNVDDGYDEDAYDNAMNADIDVNHATNQCFGNEFMPAILPEPMDASYFQNVQLSDTALLVAEAPKDRFNFTYCVFYLLGTATMTPWNFFVTAEEYWMYKFRNTTINDTTDGIEMDLTPMQKSFTCDLTLTASISGGIFLILNAIYGHHFSHKIRMYTALVIILIIFIITTSFVEVNTDYWQQQFFLITLLTVVIINTSSATVTGVAFSIASLFPSKYITALVSGQALGGIFTALVLILVLAIGAPPNITAFIFFNIGTFLILLSLIMYAIMRRQAFFQYYEVGMASKFKIASNTPSTSKDREGRQMIGVALEPNFCEVLGKIYLHVVCVFLVWSTTLSVYPAVSVLMQSEQSGHGYAWNDIYYVPVVNYLLFNVADYVGRILAGIVEAPRNPYTILLMAFVRVFFLPLFLCSNTALHHFLPVVIQKDVSFIIMMTMFAISNGYVTNISLLLAPRICMQHEKEIASSIMVAGLNIGLVVGSMTSMIFVRLL